MQPFRDPLLSIMLVGLALLCLYAIVRFARQVWVINFPRGKSLVKDVTEQNTPLFADAESTARRIEMLGLQPFGITEVTLAAYPQKPKHVWYYINEDKSIHAELAEFKPKDHRVLLRFMTWFPNDAMIETFYPSGENLETPTFSSHFVRDDLERGYWLHQQKVEMWMPIHGTPVPVESMTLLLGYGAKEDELFRKWRYRRITWLFLLAIAALSVSTLTIAVSLMLIWLVDISDLEVLGNIHLLSMGLVMGGLIAFSFIHQLLQKPPGALDEKPRKKIGDD